MRASALSFCPFFNLREVLSIDDFYIAPSELAQNPDVEEWARVKLNERYSKYAAFGYVPAMAMGGMR